MKYLYIFLLEKLLLDINVLSISTSFKKIEF